MNYENFSCQHLHTFDNFTSRCNFVKNASDCIFGDGHIEYIQLIYCNADGTYIPLALVLLLIWCIILLLFLAIVADEFFGPALVVIAKLLHLSDNLAGVTLLALGNGAADIFSAIAAAQTTKDGDAGLLYGSLLGAGVLVTTVTTGCVAIVKPFTTQRRPIVKDIVFYIAAILWNLSILIKKYIHFAEAVGFIILYVVYVVITVVSRSLRQRMLRSEKEDDDEKSSRFKRGGREPRISSVDAPTRGIQLLGLKPLPSADNPAYVPGPPEVKIELPSIQEESGRTEDTPESAQRNGHGPSHVEHHVHYDESCGPEGGLRRAEDVAVRRRAPVERSSSAKRSVSVYHGLNKRLTATHKTAGGRPSYLTKWVMAYRSEDDALLPQEVSQSGDIGRQRSVSHIGVHHRSTGSDPPQPGRQRSVTYDHSSAIRGRRTVSVGAPQPRSSADNLASVTFPVPKPQRGASYGDSEFMEVPLTPEPAQPEIPTKEDEEDEEDEVYEVPGIWMHFLQTINPLDAEEWLKLPIFWKIFEIIRCPIRFILILILPLVDYDHPTQGWCKLLIMLQCILTPLFWLFSVKVIDVYVGGVMPVWAIAVLAGLLFAAVIFFTSEHDKPPRYHFLFSFIGFATAIVSIYTLTNEVVNILPTFGAALKISKAILALTFLAWANSIGDIMSNTILAKNNFPRIAISACFGGPLFNILLGVGIPFTMLTAQNGYSFPLRLSFVQLILIVFLLIALVSHLVLLFVFKFNIRRQYGIYFFILYGVFLVFAILAELKVLPSPFEE